VPLKVITHAWAVSVILFAGWIILQVRAPKRTRSTADIAGFLSKLRVRPRASFGRLPGMRGCPNGRTLKAFQIRSGQSCARRVAGPPRGLRPDGPETRGKRQGRAISAPTTGFEGRVAFKASQLKTCGGMRPPQGPNGTPVQSRAGGLTTRCRARYARGASSGRGGRTWRWRKPIRERPGQGPSPLVDGTE